MTKDQAIIETVATMGMLKFFPTDEFARAAIMQLLSRISSPVEAVAIRQLREFSDFLMARYNEWPGPQEIRALWCTKWAPVDGVEANLQMRRPGEDHPVTAENEARYLEGHEDRKRLADGTRDRELAKLVVDIAKGKVLPS